MTELDGVRSLTPNNARGPPQPKRKADGVRSLTPDGVRSLTPNDARDRQSQKEKGYSPKQNPSTVRVIRTTSARAGSSHARNLALGLSNLAT